MSSKTHDHLVAKLVFDIESHPQRDELLSLIHDQLLDSVA